MRWKKLIGFTLLACGFTSMRGLAQVPVQEKAVDTQLRNKLAEADNRFGFKLLFWLAGENFAAGKAPKNLFVSPASIAWALDMTLNGAEGATLSEMMQALEVSDWKSSDLNTANAALMQGLMQATPGVEFSVANSLWGKSGVNFLPEFLKQAEQYYQAKLATLTGAAPINAWVSEKTKDKITSILEEQDITPDTILVLVNALYFKGAWERPFDKVQTTPEDFHLTDGKTKSIPMMHQSGRYNYYEEAGVQFLKLPYGEGEVNFYLALPAAGSSLHNFVKNLDAGRWKALLNGLTSRPGKITLPRFKVEYGVGLVPAMRALGMSRAFTDQAEFKKIALVPPAWWIKISEIRHKTFVEVNEQGTEAAAVTAVSMRAGSAPPPPQAPFTMVVNRPFFIAIQDQRTGLMLFMGTIVEP